MIAALGTRVSRVFEKTAPDPFVLAVILTFVAGGLALTLGDYAGKPDGVGRMAYTLDAWRGSEGVWKFLTFSMQMCLILVTGHALAASRPVQFLLRGIASLPRSPGQAAALVGLVAAALGLINWGLGLIAGALLARDVGRSLAERGITVHYPLLAAAGYVGMLVWHGGLSGSAPLTVTSYEGAASVLPADSLAALGDSGIGLEQTIWSPMNLFVSLGFLVIVPGVLWMLTPPAHESRTIDGFIVQELVRESEGKPRTIPERFERSPWLAFALAALLLVAAVRFMQRSGIGRLGLNEINAIMFAVGLICHRSLSSYIAAAEEGAKGCVGIIIQFPLYAGIMAVLAASGLVHQFSELLAKGGETGVPILTFLSAGVVNFFVPSGGGQWGIQGPIALEAGAAAGVTPGKMVMAVAYGDQLTNMLQPFWALPLLAITGVKARELVGYTSVVMVAAAAWIVLALLIF